MADDKFNEILAAIENLRSDNTLSHKALDLMIKEVRDTQKEHTEAFDRITKAISKSVMGKMAPAINALEDRVCLERTEWT